MFSLVARIKKLNLFAVIKHKHFSDQYIQLMFNAIPLSCSLWDDNYKIMNCNEETARLFHLSGKVEFGKIFPALSPEYQPNGDKSFEKARENLHRAFNEGYCRFEWMHLTGDGNPLPCEVILVRVEHAGKPIVAAYIRDLREKKATLSAMHKVEADLRMALVAAEENAKAKSEFLDNMSHELRTPMNGVLGFLRLAAQTEMTAEQQKYIDEAERSAKNLMRIIDDVLDFTEIENKKMTLNAVRFQLSDVFGDMADAFARIVKEKNLEFNLRLPPELPRYIYGDLVKLEKVLFNLIDNAVKFTEKGKVTVRVKTKRQTENMIELCFYVRDTGIGIKPDQMDSLFEPFWQADSSLTRKHGGTGFGLPLSKHLATLLGGRIWAESEFEEGSTFFFTARFNLGDTLLSEPAGTTHTDKGETEALSHPSAGKAAEITEAQPEPASMQPEPAAAAAAQPEPALAQPASAVAAPVAHKPENPSLLVVEDVEINQMIVEGMLSGMGYNVDIANNGQEAIDMIASKEYSAVLMDIQMPVLDGLTATTRIRNDTRYKDLPIIAVSAHAKTEDKEKSLACGMNDHITKPINPDVLYMTLNKWLQPA